MTMAATSWGIPHPVLYTTRQGKLTINAGAATTERAKRSLVTCVKRLLIRNAASVLAWFQAIHAERVVYDFPTTQAEFAMLNPGNTNQAPYMCSVRKRWVTITSSNAWETEPLGWSATLKMENTTTGVRTVIQCRGHLHFNALEGWAIMALSKTGLSFSTAHGVPAAVVESAKASIRRALWEERAKIRRMFKHYAQTPTINRLPRTSAEMAAWIDTARVVRE